MANTRTAKVGGATIDGTGMEAILQVERLSRRFGGLAALDDLSFAIRSGEIRGLIGPNGAGKTTTFNVISGFYAPSSGRVLFEGRDISGQRTSRVAALGLVRTFQQTTLFQELSVLDNVLVGGHLRARRGLLVTLFGRARGNDGPAPKRSRCSISSASPGGGTISPRTCRTGCNARSAWRSH
ncbi:MAG TPA: ATP-binding cassette domain-containing protein [Vicinamibacterales bacterium]|nr:ATP-binding cassette domain-containing protein [Vicinamibacterales bacterium]